MREENIEKMNFRELRAEVQLLRDELALMKRKYEDILYNLDDENFSSRIVREKDDMKAEIKVTAEEISTKVSKTDFESGIKQTAESINSYVAKINNLSSATEAEIKDDFKDTEKTYVIRTYDENGNVTEETYYYYNNISEKWEVLSGEYLYTLFEQTEDGFKLKGNVKVDGSCILTGSLTFDSSDNPLQVQYSPDGSTWHEPPFVSNSDKFMRIKIGGEWSSEMKVVGDDGQDVQPGSAASVDAETIFELLTDNGKNQGIFPAFYDNEEKLFINAEYIKGETLSGVTVESEGVVRVIDSNASDDMRVGGYITIYNGTSPTLLIRANNSRPIRLSTGDHSFELRNDGKIYLDDTEILTSTTYAVFA